MSAFILSCIHSQSSCIYVSCMCARARVCVFVCLLYVILDRLTNVNRAHLVLLDCAKTATASCLSCFSGWKGGNCLTLVYSTSCAETADCNLDSSQCVSGSCQCEPGRTYVPSTAQCENVGQFLFVENDHTLLSYD